MRPLRVQWRHWFVCMLNGCGDIAVLRVPFASEMSICLFEIGSFLRARPVDFANQLLPLNPYTLGVTVHTLLPWQKH